MRFMSIQIVYKPRKHSLFDWRTKVRFVGYDRNVKTIVNEMRVITNKNSNIINIVKSFNKSFKLI